MFDYLVSRKMERYNSITVFFPEETLEVGTTSHSQLATRWVGDNFPEGEVPGGRLEGEIRWLVHLKQFLPTNGYLTGAGLKPEPIIVCAGRGFFSNGVLATTITAAPVAAKIQPPFNESLSQKT